MQTERFGVVSHDGMEAEAYLTEGDFNGHEDEKYCCARFLNNKCDHDIENEIHEKIHTERQEGCRTVVAFEDVLPHEAGSSISQDSHNPI